MSLGEAGVHEDKENAGRPFGQALRRLLDERDEPRTGASQTAVMSLRGANHVVRVSNLSRSGVNISFSGTIADGERVTIQLLDHGLVGGQVRWTRENRVGIQFDTPLGAVREQD